MPVGAPTPIVITRRQRNLLVMLGIVALVLLCWKAPAMVKITLAGGATALLLSFPIRLLSRFLPRGLATALVLLLLVIGLAAGVLVLVPLAVSQLTSLVQSFPEMAARVDDLLKRGIDFLSARGLLGTTPDVALKDLETAVVGKAQEVGQAALGGGVAFLSGAFGTMLMLFAVMFVALFLLSNTSRIKARAIRAMPVVYRDDAEILWDESGEALSRYLLGLAIGLSFQGITAAIVLYLLGVPYSLLLGIWTAIGAIVPYVGSYIGAIPAVIAGFFVSPTTALLVAATYFAINQIDGNLIAPRVQGKAIGVSPLIVFLGVIAGGQIAGLWGALLVVPLLAVSRVVVQFLDERLQVEDDGPPIIAVTTASPAALAAFGDRLQPASPAPAAAGPTQAPSAD